MGYRNFSAKLGHQQPLSQANIDTTLTVALNKTLGVWPLGIGRSDWSYNLFEG